MAPAGGGGELWKPGFCRDSRRGLGGLSKGRARRRVPGQPGRMGTGRRAGAEGRDPVADLGRGENSFWRSKRPPPSNPQSKILGEFNGGGRGDCSILAGKLPAGGPQAGHCGVAAQVTPASDADGRGSRELAWGPGLMLRAAGLVPLGIGGEVGGFKRMDRKTHGGRGEGKKGRL